MKSHPVIFTLIFLLIFLFWLLFYGGIIWVSNDLSWAFPPSISLNNLGVFGDSFNVLTSLFTGLAFAGVIISVILQTKELEATREEFRGQKEALEKQQEEMVNQSFDNKFFQLLNLLNSIRSSFLMLDNKGINRFSRLKFSLMSHVQESQDKDELLIRFNLFNHENSEYFKYYFINLYQILKYIDKQKMDDSVKKEYTNIIRAQLSTNELILLFFNAFCIIDISGDEYKRLVEEYSFFEHLDYTILNKDNIYPLVDVLLMEYDLTAFGNNESIKTKIEELNSIPEPDSDDF